MTKFGEPIRSLWCKRREREWTFPVWKISFPPNPYDIIEGSQNQGYLRAIGLFRQDDYCRHKERWPNSGALIQISMKRTEGMGVNVPYLEKSRLRRFPTIQSLGSVVHGYFLGIPVIQTSPWLPGRDTVTERWSEAPKSRRSIRKNRLYHAPIIKIRYRMDCPEIAPQPCISI